MSLGISLAFMGAAVTLDTREQQRASLASELNARGLAIIEPALIRKHQNEMRFGLYRGPRLFLARLLSMVASVLLVYATDRVVTRILRRYPERELSIAAAIMVTFVATMVIGSALFEQGHTTAAAIFLLPGTIIASWMVLTIISAFADVQGAVFAYWATLPFAALDKPDAPALSKMPNRLKERARRAGSIPGTRILVSYLHTDPILYVERTGRFGRERVAIGAWDTRDRHLDNF